MKAGGSAAKYKEENMKNQNFFHHGIAKALVIVLLAGCGAPAPAAASVSTQTATPIPVATATLADTATAAPTEPVSLWADVTESTIGETGSWTNKVELADINGDGLVDLLFANGGDYETPGEPEFSQVFLNQGEGQSFREVTQDVFGPDGMLVRVIKVRFVRPTQQEMQPVLHPNVPGCTRQVVALDVLLIGCQNARSSSRK